MTDEQKNNTPAPAEPTPSTDGGAKSAPEKTPSPAVEAKPAESSAPAKNAAPAPANKGPQSGPQRGGPGGRGGFGGNRGGGGGFGGNRGGGGRGGRRGGPRQGRKREKPEFESKTLDIARVSRVTKGGKRFSFRATVVIGDQKGRVGVGIGKGQDVVRSITKAYAQAKKEMMTVLTLNDTIPYQVEAKFSSAQVLLKPARGGIKAGGAVRVVAQMAGIHSLTGKNLGRTNNKLNIARATVEALSKLRPTRAMKEAMASQKAAKEAKEAQEAKENKEENKEVKPGQATA